MEMVAYGGNIDGKDLVTESGSRVRGEVSLYSKISTLKYDCAGKRLVIGRLL